MTDMHAALAQVEFLNREHLISHLPYDRETAFYRSIQAGDAAEAMRLFTPLGQEASAGSAMIRCAISAII